MDYIRSDIIHVMTVYWPGLRKAAAIVALLCGLGGGVAWGERAAVKMTDGRNVDTGRNGRKDVATQDESSQFKRFQLLRSRDRDRFARAVYLHGPRTLCPGPGVPIPMFIMYGKVIKRDVNTIYDREETCAGSVARTRRCVARESRLARVRGKRCRFSAPPIAVRVRDIVIPPYHSSSPPQHLRDRIPVHHRVFRSKSRRIRRGLKRHLLLPSPLPPPHLPPISFSTNFPVFIPSRTIAVRALGIYNACIYIFFFVRNGRILYFGNKFWSR